MLLNVAKCLVTAFTVSELLGETNQKGGGGGGGGLKFGGGTQPRLGLTSYFV